MKKPTINYDDFQKLDIRIGEVKDASLIDGSKKLLSLSVDLGEEWGIVEVLTGMAEFYTPQDFIGKKFMFLANLEPKPMMGHVSNGMLMAADIDGKPILSPVSNDIQNGTIVR